MMEKLHDEGTSCIFVYTSCTLILWYISSLRLSVRTLVSQVVVCWPSAFLIFVKEFHWHPCVTYARTMLWLRGKHPCFVSRRFEVEISAWDFTILTDVSVIFLSSSSCQENFLNQTVIVSFHIISS
jgi:hypothetical protein